VFDHDDTLAAKARGAAERWHGRIKEAVAGTPVAGLANKLPMPQPMRAARTYPSLMPWLKMDRIYQRGFIVHHAEVLKGPVWAQLSDHSPVIAEVELA
jgi:endonuclease/exonuclease/phosphatase family metal-dependent hydrolase